MAHTQIFKPSFFRIPAVRIISCRKISSFCLNSVFSVKQKKMTKLQNRRNPNQRGYSVCCRLQESDNESNGEEPPESLFMKELRRRGMNSTSLLEDSSRSMYGRDEEEKLEEDGGSSSQRRAVLQGLEKSSSNQRQISMALNSEGLEGLIPRAKLLLTLGGTFIFGFWPVIPVTVAFFSALYFYFGPSFVHDASKTPISPPSYIDPYALLEDDRISKSAPHVN